MIVGYASSSLQLAPSSTEVSALVKGSSLHSSSVTVLISHHLLPPSS